MGVEHGIVRKAGAWYTYEGEQLGQGKENARGFLRDNPDLANEIEKKIKEKLGIVAVLDAEPIGLVDPVPVDSGGLLTGRDRQWLAGCTASPRDRSSATSRGGDGVRGPGAVPEPAGSQPRTRARARAQPVAGRSAGGDYGERARSLRPTSAWSTTRPMRRLTSAPESGSAGAAPAACERSCGVGGSRRR